MLSWKIESSPVCLSHFGLYEYNLLMTFEVGPCSTKGGPDLFVHLFAFNKHSQMNNDDGCDDIATESSSNTMPDDKNIHHRIGGDGPGTR